MSDVIDLDFTGAPPSEGPAFSDHIAPGVYDLKVAKVESMSSSGGKPMVVATLRVAGGPETGKRLVDMFVIPRNAEESKVGLMRLHMLLVALGSKEIPGKYRIDLGKLVGRVLKAEVEDNIMPAKDNYPERITSRPSRYLKRETLTGTTQTAQSPAQTPAPTPKPAAPAPQPAPVQAKLPEPATEEAPPWETEDVVPVATVAPTGEKNLASKIADDLDALFGA